MRFLFTLAAVAAIAISAVPAGAQDVPQWRPSTTEMPSMPTAAEMRGDWMSRLAPWFSGLETVAGVGVSGLRAGAPRGGGPADVARFMSGPVPVVVMTDRNGDQRADMIEYFRDGRLVAQVIDANYSGQANSVRFYDTAGGLIREVRL
jgi:hypothetical protein